MITAAAAKGVLGAIGRRIPLRWLLYAGVASAACILASRYIAEIFVFAKWAGIAAASLCAGVLVWEVACLYYTGHIDMPGDGIKPTRR